MKKNADGNLYTVTNIKMSIILLLPSPSSSSFLQFNSYVPSKSVSVSPTDGSFTEPAVDQSAAAAQSTTIHVDELTINLKTSEINARYQQNDGQEYTRVTLVPKEVSTVKTFVESFANFNSSNETALSDDQVVMLGIMKNL